MSKKLIVVMESGTPEQNDVITLHLKGKGWGLWHWFKDLWLLADVPDDVTPRTLWKELSALPSFDKKNMIVIAANDSPSYFGYGPKGCWPWLAERWGKPDLIQQTAQVPKTVPPAPKGG
jgi:hypothetical protein